MAMIQHTKVDFTGNANEVAVDHSCFFWGYLIGMDGSNDPTVTVHDHNAAAAAGPEVVPSNTYDASALGVNGVMFPERVEMKNGIVLAVALGAGAAEITVFHS